MRDGEFVPDAVRGARRPTVLTPSLDAFQKVFGTVSVTSTLSSLTASDFVRFIDLDSRGITADSNETYPAYDEPVPISDSESDIDANPPTNLPPSIIEEVSNDIVGGIVSSSYPAAASSSSSSSSLVARHRRRGTIHRLSPDPARASCGETLGDAFELVPLSGTSWPLCGRPNCFGRTA